MRKVVRYLSSVIALIALLPLTAAEAQNPPNPSAAITPPPLQCTVAGGTVRVTAVTDTAGNFPIPVACPAGSAVTDCLKWSYRYELIGGGNNISLSAVTVDSDVAIVAATSGSPESGGGMKVYAPAETDSGIGSVGTNSYDFRVVRFASQGGVVLGHVYTGRDVGIGSVSAVGKVGNSGATSCQIAGADNTGGASVGLATITTTQIDQFQECQITLTLDAKGCPTDISAQPPTCQVTEVTQLDGKTVRGGQCKGGTSGLVTDGSTCIYYCPTSYGTCFRVCK